MKHKQIAITNFCSFVTPRSSRMFEINENLCAVRGAVPALISPAAPAYPPPSASLPLILSLPSAETDPMVNVTHFSTILR